MREARTGGKKRYKDEEQKIKTAILDFIRYQPRKGFAWNQYNGGRYDPRRGIFLKHTKYHRKGVSDIIGIWCKRPLFIEVKAAGGVVSDDQQEFLAQAEFHGAITVVAYSLQEAVAILNSFEIPTCNGGPRPLSLRSDNEV